MNRTYTALGVLLIVAALTLPAAFGLDAEPIDVDTDAQRAAQRQASEDQCTALYGNYAIFFETKAGHLVCRDGSLP